MFIADLRRRISPRALLIGIGLTVLAAPGVAWAADAPPTCPVRPGEIDRYDVLRHGSVIGSQTVRFDGEGDDLDVEVEIGASIALLSIPVYRYHHHARERWAHGALLSLDTQTDDDGTPRRVVVHRDAQGMLHGVVGHPKLSGPVMPASLWNEQIIAQTQVIDRETGELVPMRAIRTGEETLNIGGRDVAAQRFDIEGPVKAIAWYDSSGCWLKARFKTRVDGSEVEIVRK